MSSTTKLNQSRAGKVFDVFNVIFFVVLSCVMLIPIAYVFVGSFSSSGLAQLKFGKFYKNKNADMLVYLEWLSGRLKTYKQTEANVILSEQIKEVEKWQR